MIEEKVMSERRESNVHQTVEARATYGSTGTINDGRRALQFDLTRVPITVPSHRVAVAVLLLLLVLPFVILHFLTSRIVLIDDVRHDCVRLVIIDHLARCVGGTGPVEATGPLITTYIRR